MKETHRHNDHEGKGTPVQGMSDFRAALKDYQTVLLGQSVDPSDVKKVSDKIRGVGTREAANAFINLTTKISGLAEKVHPSMRFPLEDK